MTKDEQVQQKRQAIQEQVIIINRALRMAKRIAKYPPAKKSSTKVNRMVRVLAYGCEMLAAVQRIKLIRWQPIEPNFTEFGTTDMHSGMTGKGVTAAETVLSMKQLKNIGVSSKVWPPKGDWKETLLNTD